MWEVIAAVIATALGIVVLPFVTSLVGDWLAARRDERSRRRQIFEDLVTLAAEETSKETTRRRNELRLRLDSRMGPRDNGVRKATWNAYTHAATAEANDVLRAWVFGNERLARRNAKRVTADPANTPPGRSAL